MPQACGSFQNSEVTAADLLAMHCVIKNLDTGAITLVDSELCTKTNRYKTPEPILGLIQHDAISKELDTFKKFSQQEGFGSSRPLARKSPKEAIHGRSRDDIYSEQNLAAASQSSSDSQW